MGCDSSSGNFGQELLGPEVSGGSRGPVGPVGHGIPVSSVDHEIPAGPGHHTLLPIPPRLQWDNDGGYCGQTSIQCCSLYYGNYISQSMARAAAGSEVLVGQNAEAALEKLGYIFQSWDTENRQKPQYRDYLQWIKANIKKGFPVIITGYSREGTQLQYDHIFLAMGVKCKNQGYSGDDDLIYGEGYNKDYVTTAFDKIADTREMKENGKSLDFAIPKDACFGIAIKGIRDDAKQCFPIRLVLEENKEPNICQGAQPSIFTLKIKVSNIKSGIKYSVLKYSTVQTIPKDYVEAKQASKVTSFTARGEIYQFEDTVQSNGMAFYRCIQYNGQQGGFKEQEVRKAKRQERKGEKDHQQEERKKKEGDDQQEDRKNKEREEQKSDEERNKEGEDD